MIQDVCSRSHAQIVEAILKSDPDAAYVSVERADIGNTSPKREAP